ncbi:MAG: hypothetical protein AAGH15_02250 [Myxococcota bacterium]
MNAPAVRRWAERLLSDRAVATIIDPFLADQAAAQRREGTPHPRATRDAVQLIATAWMAERADALRAASHGWLIGSASLATLLVLQLPDRRLAQWAYVVSGALAALLVLSASAGWLRRVGRGAPLLLALAALALAAFGLEHGGARAWLPLGPLRVQLGVLVLPLVVLASERPRGTLAAMAFAGAMLALGDSLAALGALACGGAALAFGGGRRAASLALVSSVMGGAIALGEPVPLVSYGGSGVFALLVTAGLLGHRDPTRQRAQFA